MRRPRSLLSMLVACLLVALAALVPATAGAQAIGGGLEAGDEDVSSERRSSERTATDEEAGAGSEDSGDSGSGPVRRARIVDGQAVAPPGAPAAVKTAIAAANSIADKPYRYGGGHAKVEDTAYDCSGAISYALIKAGVLSSPLASGPFMQWGEPGKGRWITIYAHGGHAYVMIAGLRFDTGYRGRESALVGTAPGKGPRWGYARSTAGFTARHPAGL